MSIRLAELSARALKRELEGKPGRIPDGAGAIWDAFTDLSRARGHGAFGPLPIAFSEIRAYAQIMGIPLEPRHVRVIAAMDRVWLEFANRRTDAPAGVRSLPPRSEHALTPEMFDINVS